MQLGINSKGTQKRGKFAEASIIVPSTVHTLTVVTEFFRLRMISMGTELNGSTQCIFNSFKSGKLTTFVGEKINENNDCELVRSVITGKTPGGDFVNAQLDSVGRLITRISAPLSSFGELLTVTPNPIAQIKFTYGIDEQEVKQFLNPGTIVTMGTEGEIGVAQVQSIYLPEADLMNSTGAANYFTLSDGGDNPFYIWYSIGSSTDPTPTGTGLQVTVTAGQTPSQVATATQTVVNGDAAFTAGAPFGNILTITNATSTDANPTSINAVNMPSESSSIASVVTKGSGFLTITNGAGIGDFSVVRARRSMRYRPGLGCSARFTALYDTPVSGTLQYCGVGNAVSAIYVGYNGLQFGISKRTFGLPEIQTLTITSVASATTGTVIVTIDGIDFTVTITDISSVEIVAFEIASFDYGDALYFCDQVNDRCIFSSNRLTLGAHSFTFALGTATNISGSFVETTSSINITNDIIEQSSWNVDRLDGSGPSRIVLNPQKGNVFEISYQWLGYGAITLFVADSSSGLFTPCHIFQYANSNIVPSVSQPDMKLTFFTASETSTTPVSLKTASGGIFVQGMIKRFDPHFSSSNTHTYTTSAVSNVILLKLKNPRTFREIYNQCEIILKSLTIASSKGSNNTKAITEFSLVLDGIPSADLPATFVSEDKSVAYVASPVEGIILSGGTIIFTTAITAEGSTTIDLTSINLLFEPNRDLYITYSSTGTSTSDVDIDVSLDWVEDH